MNNKMNREIKFRGKEMHNDLGWVYGSLIQCPNGACVIVTFDKDGKELSYDVDPETVGQFTGLKDKTGVEIYEGDIISSHGYSHIIEYDMQQAGFVAFIDGAPVGHRESCSLTKTWIDECEKEVIGNIYDNPELLNRV